MSSSYDIAEFVYNRIVAAKVLPEDKIFLARPATSFVGEGPVIIVYEMNGERDLYAGDIHFPNETIMTKGFSFDVLVDDYINNSRNTEAMAHASKLLKLAELAVFTERPQAVRDMQEIGIDLRMYAPGRNNNYSLNNENGHMIATGTEVMTQYTEQWTREARKHYYSKYKATIYTDESERIISFEG